MTRSERVWLWLLVMAAFLDMADGKTGWWAALDYVFAACFAGRAAHAAFWPLKRETVRA